MVNELGEQKIKINTYKITVSVLLGANVFEKGMNPSVPSQLCSQLLIIAIGLTEFFSCGKTTSLEEGNVWIEAICSLKN